MREPRLSFKDPRYPNAETDPETQASWEMVLEHEEDVLRLIRAGKGAAAALPAAKVLALCPKTPKEARRFLTRAGAQVAALAAHHGYKPSGKTQRLYNSPFKRVACFEPIGQSASNRRSQDPVGDLQKRIEALEALVKQLCRHLGLSPDELLAAA